MANLWRVQVCMIQICRWIDKAHIYFHLYTKVGIVISVVLVMQQQRHDDFAISHLLPAYLVYSMQMKARRVKAWCSAAATRFLNFKREPSMKKNQQVPSWHDVNFQKYCYDDKQLHDNIISFGFQTSNSCSLMLGLSNSQNIFRFWLQFQSHFSLYWFLGLNKWGVLLLLKCTS